MNFITHAKETIKKLIFKFALCNTVNEHLPTITEACT